MEDEIRRLNERLRKIRGNDPISRARKAAIMEAICKIRAEGAGE